MFLCSTVDDLLLSGEFDVGVVHDDVVEDARRNLVKGFGGVLRFGIDVIEGGRIAIRVFPSRALVAPSSSTQSIGQRVEVILLKPIVVNVSMTTLSCPVLCLCALSGVLFSG